MRYRIALLLVMGLLSAKGILSADAYQDAAALNCCGKWFMIP